MVDRYLIMPPLMPIFKPGPAATLRTARFFSVKPPPAPGPRRFDQQFTGQRIRPTGKPPPFLKIFGVTVAFIAFGYFTAPSGTVVPPPLPTEDWTDTAVS